MDVFLFGLDLDGDNDDISNMLAVKGFLAPEDLTAKVYYHHMVKKIADIESESKCERSCFLRNRPRGRRKDCRCSRTREGRPERCRVALYALAIFYSYSIYHSCKSFLF